MGTSSQRRCALLAALAPDLTSGPLRGNVPTRIEACRQKRYDAVLLARAGLQRLDASTAPLSVFELDPETWIPAPGQAALALETRADDRLTRKVAIRLDDPVSRLCTAVERAMLAHFATGCHAPFAAWATIRDEQLTLRLGLGPGLDGSAKQPDPEPQPRPGPWKTARLLLSTRTLDEIGAPGLRPSELGSFITSETPLQWSTAALICGTRLCRPLQRSDRGRTP